MSYDHTKFLAHCYECDHSWGDPKGTVGPLCPLCRKGWTSRAAAEVLKGLRVMLAPADSDSPCAYQSGCEFAHVERDEVHGGAWVFVGRTDPRVITSAGWCQSYTHAMRVAAMLLRSSALARRATQAVEQGVAP